MASEGHHQDKIAKYSLKALRKLWSAIESEDTPGWEAGKALEYLVLRAFQLDGAEVTWPFSVRLADDEVDTEQIDGVIYLDGLACLVECKDYRRPVNIEPIAKLRNQLLRRPASTLGIVFSRSGFTTPARLLAQYIYPQPILLWSGEEIRFALDRGQGAMREGLRTKYRHCVEFGIPDFNIKTLAF